MNKIFSSASKIVFVLVTLAAIIALFMGIISGDKFFELVMMVFVFYFTKSIPAVKSE